MKTAENNCVLVGGDTRQNYFAFYIQKRQSVYLPASKGGMFTVVLESVGVIT